MKTFNTSKMTNRIVKNFLTAIAICSIAAACKKNNDLPASTPLKADDFLAKYTVPTQSFTGNATTGFTITGAKGTKVTFKPGAFIDGFGNVVSGNVTVTLKEILSKKDVLLSGVMTESNGQLLESGGEFLLQAKQGDNVLGVNRQADSAAMVEVPKVLNNKDMGLFVQEKREGGVNGQQPQGNPLTWVAAPYAPFGNGPNSYSFSLPGFTWVNCDRFYSDPNPKTTIRATPVFQDDSTVTDLQVMLVFKNIATVITLPYSYSLQKFESYQNSLPIGLTADLVIMGKDSNGYIQFGTQTITITANMDIQAAIHRADQSEVDSFLAGIQ
ncbi:hypothetical protein SAMN05421788_101987 [Filimonas lacunae]|uniref:Uncharacterized protein n=1 Tax=Filimonas lacunae TaxID=477680 RepID=A0A173MQ24_9BACT|nr:hypothetical protein [Filimonas lacunae]BAV09549.1 hypothetical protein FLA_5600 [Filimonas lacunae]SIS75045.1 hypothetical protein SAMN05421788_101987 [Filimonas lacunae]